MEEERRKALDKAVRALAWRDHSAASLRAKLDRAGISPEVQADALDTLERAGYVDDGRFARDRAAHLAAKGYGDEWIRADLEAQGVTAEAIAPAMAELGPEADRAEREWRRVGGGLRATRSLTRRGFAEETLEGLLAQEPGTGVG